MASISRSVATVALGARTASSFLYFYFINSPAASSKRRPLFLSAHIVPIGVHRWRHELRPPTKQELGRWMPCRNADDSVLVPDRGEFPKSEQVDLLDSPLEKRFETVNAD